MSNVLSIVERKIVLKDLQEKLPKLQIKAISTEYIPSEKKSSNFCTFKFRRKKLFNFRTRNNFFY